MRILLCPVEIAGYMGRLKAGLSKLGCEARFIDLSGDEQEYGGSEQTGLMRWYRRARNELKGRHPIIRKLGVRIMQAILCAYFFAQSLVWPDVVVFCFGKTFLGGWELPLYRIFGVRVVFIYLGSDSRPPYLNGANASSSRGIGVDECLARTRRVKRRIAWLDRFADHVVDHPPSGVFHERPFVPFLRIGMPAPDIMPGAAAGEAGGPAVIVHAPSFPECKGTYRIRELVARLGDDGHEVEYVELIDKSNAEVIEALRRCSFVVDELYSDTVLAGLGTEAATLGKATMVGGYALPEDFFVGPAHLPPAFTTRPEDAYETLLRMLAAPEEVRRTGEAARSFILGHWKSELVAARFLEMLGGKIPEGELCDPRRIARTEGWGFTRERLRQYLGEYLRRHGPAGLFLDDKPALRDYLIRLASEGGDAA